MFDPTYDELEEIACGEMGMTIDYFYSLTAKQFDNILKGHQSKELKKYKERCEHARLVGYYNYLMTPLKKGYRHKKSPKKWMPFEWEQEHKNSEQIDKQTYLEQEKKSLAFFEKVDSKKGS